LKNEERKLIVLLFVLGNIYFGAGIWTGLPRRRARRHQRKHEFVNPELQKRKSGSDAFRKPHVIYGYLWKVVNAAKDNVVLLPSH